MDNVARAPFSSPPPPGGSLLIAVVARFILPRSRSSRKRRRRLASGMTNGRSVEFFVRKPEKGAPERRVLSEDGCLSAAKRRRDLFSGYSSFRSELLLELEVYILFLDSMGLWSVVVVKWLSSVKFKI